MNLYINTPHHSNKIKWVLDLMVQNHGAEISVVDSQSRSDLTIGFDLDADVKLSKDFYKKLDQHIFDHKSHMPNGPYISDDSGDIDYISSIFYLTNCIQEYHGGDLDHYNRFKYTSSLQYRWGIVTENKVWEYINSFLEEYKIKYHSPAVLQAYLTHDIDFIYSGWKAEGMAAIKKGKIFTFIKLAIQHLLGKPLYDNIASIAKKEGEKGFSSTFFWIPVKGRCNEGIKNADYSLSDDRAVKAFDAVKKAGSELGLHKSTLSSTFQEELSMFDNEVMANRYHFLKFNLPSAFDTLEASGMKIDTSLGFAEHYGYRNSYGLPFFPYNIAKDRPYTFLEVPLHIMDGTMVYYMNMPQEDVYTKMSQWIESVKDHTLITMLWHNNELAGHSFEGMTKCYWKLLDFLILRGIRSVTQKDLLTKMRHSE